MIVLDTDHVSHLQYPESAAAQRLQSRLDNQPDRQIGTTIITLEEQFRGWVAEIARAQNLTDQVRAYRRLGEVFDVYSRLTIVPFDQASADLYLQIRNLRGGTMDKKIASIALASSALLLTANSRDLAQIPGLQFADWTA